MAVRLSQANYAAMFGPTVGDRVRQELESVPVSGVVLVTDGADNSRAPIGDQLLSLRARSIPVFTVGVGEERFNKDIEIRRVEAPHTVMRGSAVAAEALARIRALYEIEEAIRGRSPDERCAVRQARAGQLHVTVGHTDLLVLP